MPVRCSAGQAEAGMPSEESPSRSSITGIAARALSKPEPNTVISSSHVGRGFMKRHSKRENHGHRRGTRRSSEWEGMSPEASGVRIRLHSSRPLPFHNCSTATPRASLSVAASGIWQSLQCEKPGRNSALQRGQNTAEAYYRLFRSQARARRLGWRIFRPGSRGSLVVCLVR